MFSILLAMACIILIGVLWRLYLGAKVADIIRSHLAKSVYEIFLPALVLHVLWQAELSLNTVRIPVVAALSVLLCLLATFLIYGNGLLIKKMLGPNAVGKKMGALMLAAAFGNFSYLGIPVLTQVFGSWSQFVAVHFDMLASTPLLFTVGILVAGHYGKAESAGASPFELLKVPALWAAALGLIASANHLFMPDWLEKILSLLGSAVVPLMLLSVGMALRWRAGWFVRIPLIFPVIAIQLMLMPLIAWTASVGVRMPENLIAPVVIEGAMPSMVLGLVICDRFKLDTALYAEIVTLSTALSLLSLPFWMAWLHVA
ncbi:MAG: Auxin Efflux carrier [Zetaproteobacteria bacterium CG_4_9_14_3_um_filter_49_83]|nr:MAG: Auxin Efflux carrier [Zetaproteobacteria bacterium CG1_02_49_23]PIQ33652.1 MAG: Auxin Efflux carrier [Zetaproteobacteria bacterium CG17_big_fil_post_rev_8_21_14_2_50_50_13]PIV30121.1 MAG: Auxin Efflux carrier [Zetaproteobacteria bacterium CG02_land_8_20_14_3_00_50_9]PIY54559.1 MAG: Auxin Efflux carrier [Zetaproteobacteria bacterium CG_4_10_14_0_8_um_filter_49_80]PJA36476.1 MAG: Auxin Efflux carrier [Zetaproteobacteria bacterium CG_4_9_14_3_um_filter_49_83]